MAEEYNITVRAGPESETLGEPFRYVTSPIPEWVKNVDEEPYSTAVQTALSGAAEMVRNTGKTLTVTLGVKIDNSS